jgi:hypothetical protein
MHGVDKTMKRLNITLPMDIFNQIKSLPNKSRFIAEALTEKIRGEKRKELETLMAEGYQKGSAAAVDKKEDFDWDRISLKQWQ